MGRTMSTGRQDTTTNMTNQDEILEETSNFTELDVCSCLPISSLCLHSTQELDRETLSWYEDEDENEPLLPTPLALNTLLRTRMQALLPSCTSLSILLLHVAQLEDIHMMPGTGTVRKRRRYHPSASVVEQILTNVRRAIRIEDTMYLETGKGAAILFPNVDLQGAHTILDRVYNNVDLLQAETIIPPLTHETDIVFGIASYPEQGQSLEQVLANAGRVIHRLTLRPAITSRLWDTMPLAKSSQPFLAASSQKTQADENPQHTTSAPASHGGPSSAHDTSVPFLRLPATLPKRLKCLLPHEVASQFRCIPVGRDHNRLTLAMADPTDTTAIHALHAHTGLSVFPVSCDEDALDALLAEQW